MNLKEMIRFGYGLIMGTSTPFLKPGKRFLFPTYRMNVDAGLGIFLGGSGICGVLTSGGEALIINVNQGEAATAWREWCRERGVELGKTTLVLSSTGSDFSGGLDRFAGVARILVGPASERILKSDLGREMVEQVVALREEAVLKIGAETVRLIPVGPASGASDLAVYIESRGLLFSGPLIYNCVHPPLHAREGFDPAAWAQKASELIERLKPRQIVPAEGDLMTIERSREFIQYLRDLMDPAVEFSQCRARYDWPEIPRHTSLEENFDLLREKTKSFTSLGRA